MIETGRSCFLTLYLVYIHGQGIMHRDQKPTNIFIGKDHRAKIGDFGFARKCKLSPVGKTSENDLSQNVGTYLYVAPEVKNSTVYDKNADIYSLGMILFEMYHKMGSGTERIEIMEKLKKQEFCDLNNIPDEFSNIRILVKSLLCHDPSLRETLKRIIKLLSPLEQRRCLRSVTVSLGHKIYIKQSFNIFLNKKNSIVLLSFQCRSNA